MQGPHKPNTDRWPLHAAMAHTHTDGDAHWTSSTLTHTHRDRMQSGAPASVAFCVVIKFCCARSTPAGRCFCTTCAALGPWCGGGEHANTGSEIPITEEDMLEPLRE